MRDNMDKYLIDTSSLFNLLSTASQHGQDLLENSFITDLTIFEIGNVLWKRKDSGLKGMPEEKIMALSKVIGNILKEVARCTVTAAEIPDILALAIKRKITFYDASYIHVCNREKIGLISEDVGLRRKAGEEKVRAFLLSEVLPVK